MTHSPIQPTDGEMTYKERRVMLEQYSWAHMAMAFFTGAFMLWILQELFK